MKKLILSILVSYFLISCIFLGASAAETADINDGTIDSADDLLLLMTTPSAWAGDYRLTKDIDMTGVTGQAPIGDGTTPFTGVFNGQGHTVSGLNISASTEFSGLFGKISEAAIQYVTASGNVTSTASHVGGIVGAAYYSFLVDCKSEVNVSGAQYVGGIAGRMYDTTAVRCHNKGTVTSDKGDLGGVAALLYDSNLTDCFAEGTVKYPSSCNGGGMIGRVYGTVVVSNCYANVTLEKKGSSTPSNLGTFVGNTSNGTMTFTNCFYSGELVGGNVDGVVAYTDSSFDLLAGENGSWILLENGPALNVFEVYEDIAFTNGKSKLIVDGNEGYIKSMHTESAGEWRRVIFRRDGYKTAWKWNGEAVSLTRAEDDTFYAVKDNVKFGLSYELEDDGTFVIVATLQNLGETDIMPDAASLTLGIDTYMTDYDNYVKRFFPTLLRCEETHLWGYFATPLNRVLAIATDTPVASYSLEYMGNKHRIYTATIDMLHKGPLPERHPDGMNILSGGETKEWRIYLTELDTFEDILTHVPSQSGAPTISIDKLTVEPGETTTVTVYSLKKPELKLDGKAIEVTVIEDGYVAKIDTTGFETGTYTITAECDGYVAEATIAVRESWLWYIDKARDASVDAPQKATTHTESWYGFFSAALGGRYAPDVKYDYQSELKFEEVYSLYYDEENVPLIYEWRVQNHFAMISLLVDRYEMNGDKEELEKANDLADLVMKYQHADGGFYTAVESGGTDYTVVLYPAKNLSELFYHELALSNDETLSEEERAMWRQRYETHFDSAKRAVDHLVDIGGRFQTEGQATWEDGTYTCAATSIAEFALQYPEGSAEREKYTEAAVMYAQMHRAMDQELIPDARINGGTLRFWEAQYDVLIKGHNMMNAPHGWSAWKVYGYFDLYELTGDTYYLEKGMNALGAFAQLIAEDGTLRWAFIIDPYIEAQVFVEDPDNPGKGIYEDQVIGEQYVDMISYWWRAPYNTRVGGYTGQGGCCDNDVHEVFKCIGEKALTKAYAIENEDGTFTSYNCTVTLDGEKVVVTPTESINSSIHVNLKKAHELELRFPKGTQTALADAGMTWYRTEEFQRSDFVNATEDEVFLNDVEFSFDVGIEVSPEKTEYKGIISGWQNSITITPVVDDYCHATVNGEWYEGEPIEISLKNTDKVAIQIAVFSPLGSVSKTYNFELERKSVNIAADGCSIESNAQFLSGFSIEGLTDGSRGVPNDNSTVSATKLNYPVIFTLSWEKAQTFSAVSLWTWYGYGQGPKAWTIEAQTADGWTEIGSVKDHVWELTGDVPECCMTTFDSPITATAVRITVTEAYDTWSKLALNEIEVLQLLQPAEKGDADGDGFVTVTDALLLLKSISANTGYDQTLDMNDDGKVDLIDVLRCLKKAVA